MHVPTRTCSKIHLLGLTRIAFYFIKTTPKTHSYSVLFPILNECHNGHIGIEFPHIFESASILWLGILQTIVSADVHAVKALTSLGRDQRGPRGACQRGMLVLI